MCELVLIRLAIELLGELPARAHQPAHLVGDVHREANRAALVGERTRDSLADPPRRVGRKLVAHLVVELLDRADQPEVALLDQVEERDSGFRVVPGDRHHEPEIRLDQFLLRFLVALVLAAGELSLLRRRQQGPVADRPDVELERILGGRGGLGRLRAVVLVVLVLGLGGVVGGLGQQLEPRLGRGFVIGRKVGERPLLHHQKGYRPWRDTP